MIFSPWIYILVGIAGLSFSLCCGFLLFAILRHVRTIEHMDEKEHP